MTNPEAGSSQDASANSNMLDNRLHNTLYLLRINLPKFSGEFTEWETFRDHFNSIVVDQTELWDITRMHYLLSCLKDEANDLVKISLPITGTNFKVAWTILHLCYNNH